MSASNDTTNTPTKKCTGPCGRTLPATTEYFYSDLRNNDGLIARCKDCVRLRQNAYESLHRDERRAYSRSYYRGNLDRIHAHRREVYSVHKDKILARNRMWSKEHRKEARERVVAWRKANPDRVRDYNASLKAKMLTRIRSHNRRALKKAQGDTITKSEYDAVLAAHTNKKGQVICAWCGKPIKGDWHFDHWIPLSKGGRHEAGNLRVMHGKDGDKCNLKKGAILPFDFGKLI